MKNSIIYFMAWRHYAAGLSLLLIIGSIISLAVQGLNYGLDFTGGTLVELHYDEAQPLETIRNNLEEAGYDGAVVVHFGSENDILIRLSQGYDDELGEGVVNALQSDTDSAITLRRVEFVGPQISAELKEQGGLALLLALGLVMLYVSLRFQLKFAVAAVVALIHDVIITLGLFSFFQWPVDLTVMAAVLALIGYSINDTIVVADRIRENFRVIRKAEPLSIINTSLTETLSRTLVTSFTTLLVLVALFFFGGTLIHYFSVALIIGVFVGTYSSIYVAANVLLLLNITQEDLLVPVKEGGELVDDMP